MIMMKPHPFCEPGSGGPIHKRGGISRFAPVQQKETNNTPKTKVNGS